MNTASHASLHPLPKLSGPVSATARAVYLGAPLDMQRLRREAFIAEEPLVQCVGAGHAVLFRWGVAVSIGISDDEQRELEAKLQQFVTRPHPVPPVSTEHAILQIGQDDPERAFDGTIWLHALDTPRMQLVAHALAASALLTHYENEVARSFETIEPLARALRSSGTIPRATRHLVRDIGRVLEIRVLTVGRAAVQEKPDFLWDYPELERLYARLDDEFDIAERVKALEARLSLLNDTSSVALSLIQNQRAYYLEWSIVILIVLELFLGLFELFHPH